MCRALIVIWLYVLGVAPVLAGAWLRDKGSGFASATSTLRNSNGVWSTEVGYYADFGLTARLSFGVDLNDNDNLSGHALVFARLPLSRLTRQYQLAAELALGGAHYRNAWQPMRKLTLSYGRTFESNRGYGWVAVDGIYETRGTHSEPILKLDATIGLSDPDHLRPLLQLETAKISGQPLFYAITPALQIPLTQDSILLIGVEHRVSNHRSLGFKLGVWHRF